MRAKTRKCNHSTNSSTLRHVNTHIHTYMDINTHTDPNAHHTHANTQTKKTHSRTEKNEHDNIQQSTH